MKYQQEQKDFNNSMVIVPFISRSSLKLKIKGHKTAEFFFSTVTQTNQKILLFPSCVWGFGKIFSFLIYIFKIDDPYCKLQKPVFHKCWQKALVRGTRNGWNMDEPTLQSMDGIMSLVQIEWTVVLVHK